ncbi:Hypothetical protein SCF082_LOCUS29937 [Durusdinium trenchii]|uniref:Nuf2 DHR10-like domain-containing protein n=1 Tax=Durusdinium trenchii TaxID=1381693 RepID=A0ABP0MVD4_9DINO
MGHTGSCSDRKGSEEKVQRLEECLKQETERRLRENQDLKKELLHPKLAEAQSKLEVFFLHRFEHAHTTIDALSDRLDAVEKAFVQSRANYMDQMETDAAAVGSDLDELSRLFQADVAKREERNQKLSQRLDSSKLQVADKLARDEQLSRRKYDQLKRGADDSAIQRDQEQKRFEEQLDSEIGVLRAAVSEASQARSLADNEMLAALNHYTKELQEAISHASEGALQAVRRGLGP